MLMCSIHTLRVEAIEIRVCLNLTASAGFTRKYSVLHVLRCCSRLACLTMKQNLPLVYLRSLIDLFVSFALIPSKSGMHRASVSGQIIVRSHR